jgi:transposase InsO family protein
MLLDTWLKSGLPATDFGQLVGVSSHSLYAWRRRFQEQGPEGLTDTRLVVRGSKLAEVTKRGILLLNQMHPDFGPERISALLERGPGLGASPNAVARVLREAGIEADAKRRAPVHVDRVRRFERASPNQMWQTDIFTFMMHRQNRRVFLVAFLDDNSRYIVGFGLHASMSTALVGEVFRAAATNYGPPKEVLSDRGPQYHTWRGTSQFKKLLRTYGVEQIVSRPQHPETLGKTERFWKSLWSECLAAAVFLDIEDARRRIGLYIDWYNFHRPHQGIGNAVPADRFFGAAQEVKERLKAQVAANALVLARDGEPRQPFYLMGRVGEMGLSIHAEGERVVLSTQDGRREEVHLGAAAATAQTPLPQVATPMAPMGVMPDLDPQDDVGERPGSSPLDAGLAALHQSFADGPEPEETIDGDESDADPEEEDLDEAEETETWDGADTWEPGREEEDVPDPGSAQWPEGYSGSVRGPWGERHEVLPVGRPRIAGHGRGVGATAQGAGQAAFGGSVETGGAGAGQFGTGTAADPGSAAHGAAGVWRDGAARGQAWNQAGQIPATPAGQDAGGPGTGQAAGASNAGNGDHAGPDPLWANGPQSGRMMGQTTTETDLS